MIKDRIVKLIVECEEYGHLVYKDEPSPLLHAAADSHSISKCGIVEVPLIVGGVKATINEFPHMVSIQIYKIELSIICR